MTIDICSVGNKVKLVFDMLSLTNDSGKNNEHSLNVLSKSLFDYE